jgi:hypothetical protein
MYSLIDTEAAETDTLFEQSVQLDGREYLLRFIWSTRETCWYVNFYDQDFNGLALGIKLVLWGQTESIKDQPGLLRRFQDPRIPPGKLLCSDLSDKSMDIVSKEELGSRVVLLYISADDPDLQ